MLNLLLRMVQKTRYNMSNLIPNQGNRTEAQNHQCLSGTGNRAVRYGWGRHRPREIDRTTHGQRA